MKNRYRKAMIIALLNLVSIILVLKIASEMTSLSTEVLSFTRHLYSDYHSLIDLIHQCSDPIFQKVDKPVFKASNSLNHDFLEVFEYCYLAQITLAVAISILNFLVTKLQSTHW